MCLQMIPVWSISIGHVILSFFSPLGCSLHFYIKCLYDDLYTHPPFSFRIFAHNAGSISVLGPSHLSKSHLSSVYVTALLLKYTQSYQPNSHKCIMLAVSPFITILGTSPLSSKTLFAVHDLISISNSKSSHTFFGELHLIIFLPAPFFSSLMVLSAAFYNGEYGSVCFTWQSACLALCLNTPITGSLIPSTARVLGTPSCVIGITMSHVHHFSLPFGMPCTMCSCGHKLGHINSPSVK